MFVVSLKRSGIIKGILCLSIILVVGLIIYNCSSVGQKKSGLSSVSVSDDTATDDVLAYISSLGWEVALEPDEIREIVIPHEFNDVYNEYNELQIKQGFDLRDYCGERVKKWSFTVLNYPGYENDECIKINILVSDNRVIGGDVCSVELDGFMHGLSEDFDG